MSDTMDVQPDSTYKEYVLNVRIRETTDSEATQYTFTAPQHTDVTFDDPKSAMLYADVYFAVNGFVEDGTGGRGIPPEVVVDGKDTMAAYLAARSSIDWVASLYGSEPTRIERYIGWVREQAEEIRAAAQHEEQG